MDSDSDHEIGLLSDKSFGSGEVKLKISDSPKSSLLVSTGIDNSHDMSVIQRTINNTNQPDRTQFDKLPLSDDCEKGLSSVSSDLLGEIIKYDLPAYYDEHLEEQTSFFRKIPSERIMKWSPGLLKNPLTKMREELHNPARQIFKNLLSYMFDRKTSKKPVDHVRKHLTITMNGAMALKDEAYVQVLRQITENPDQDKTNRGWNFLAILASSFSPSSKLFYSLLNFLLNEIKKSSDPNIVKRSNFIFTRLVKVNERKRKHLPSNNEITHIESMKTLQIPVSLYSESTTYVPCESYTTVREFRTSLMRSLKFSHNKMQYYSLHEVRSNRDAKEDRYMDESSLLCDDLSIWEKEIADGLKKMETIDFKIYLRIFLYFPFTENDIDTVAMSYIQAAYDYINGKYPLKENELIDLAATSLILEFSGSKDMAYQALQRSIEKYIPNRYFSLNPSMQWIQQIMESYSNLSMRINSKVSAQLHFLNLLKNSHLWDVQQFHVQFPEKYNQNNLDSLPEDLIVGVGPKGVIICDLDRNELESVPFHKIASWGSNNIVVVIVFEKKGEIIKYYFETNQTKSFQFLLECYSNLIIGKTIQEVISKQSQTQATQISYKGAMSPSSQEANGKKNSEELEKTLSS